jgi:adenine-specific DNA-methyltransferase
VPKLAPDTNKLRGGFYTPDELTRFLVDWAVGSNTRSVLEPSCGDGAFITALARRSSELASLDTLAVTATEIDGVEASAARARMWAGGLSGRVVDRDFFNVVTAELASQRFDAIVGNPPFIRFQYFPEAQRELAFSLMAKLGLTPNRLTNAWVPFVAVAASLLSSQGRLAMIVPAELLQVTYAAELRRFLVDTFGRITLVTFRDLVFTGVEQEVVLLLAEGNETAGGVRVIELDGLDDLRDRSLLDRTSAGLPVDHSTEKWTQYFLSEREFTLMRALRVGTVPRLGQFASVDVGVVTGNNDFFVLDPSSEWSADLAPFLSPIVHRSSQLRGFETRADDWMDGAGSNGGRHLLTVSNDLQPEGKLAEYIAFGASRGVNQGYKCRIRRHWHVVPSVHIPDAFMLRQIYSAPRLSVNALDATSTDTVHRVRFLGTSDPRTLVASFHSSMTFAFAELLGRSYGGGVLELEPTEAEHLPVAYEKALLPRFGELDSLMRSGDLDGVADITDRAIAGSVGLSTAEMAVLRGAWDRLRKRRSRRGKRSTAPIVELASTA